MRTALGGLFLGLVAFWGSFSLQSLRLSAACKEHLVLLEAKHFLQEALFGKNAQDLQRLQLSIREHERELIQKIQVASSDKLRADHIAQLRQFNQAYYVLPSDHEAEAVYKALQRSPGLFLLSGRQASSLYLHLLKQYDEVFSAALPLSKSSHTAPKAVSERSSSLYEDLHSIDLFRSHRARWFLSFGFSWLVDSASRPENPNSHSAARVIKSIVDLIEGEELAPPHWRNALPIGKPGRRTKIAYRVRHHELVDAEKEDLQTLIELLQEASSDKEMNSNDIDTLVALFHEITPAQIFQIADSKQTGDSLSIAQIIELMPESRIPAALRSRVEKLRLAHPFLQ